MTESFSSRRRFPRIATQHAVLVKKLGSELEEFGRTTTMARGGCSFVAEESVGVGSHLELLITVDGVVVTARGRVIYENAVDGRHEIGVEFAGVDDAVAIERLLTKSE
jgi:hypothetical protein